MEWFAVAFPSEGNSAHNGGSAPGWSWEGKVEGDARSYVSTWGDERDDRKGGCCSSSTAEKSTGWERSFKLSYFHQEARLVLRLRAVNGTVADLSPTAHRLTTAGKNGAEPTSAVRDFSELNMHTGDGQAEFIISTNRTLVRTDYFVVEPTDAEKDLSGGSAAGVFERASNSWSVSTWIKLSKYVWKTGDAYAESLLILSDRETLADCNSCPKYLEIRNGYMSYALDINNQHASKPATTQRIPLGKWTHLEWSVVDGTIRTYVNGVQTDLVQGPGVSSHICFATVVFLILFSTSFSFLSLLCSVLLCNRMVLTTVRCFDANVQ